MRNYYNLIVRIAHVAATIAALVIAIGASVGFYHMTGNYWIAALGGVGIASVLALGWWALITAGSRARRVPARLTIVALGLVLFATALGTSGWALATAIGGEQAMAVHNNEQIDRASDAVTRAHARAKGQMPLIDRIAEAEAAYRGYAEAEAAGDISGTPGCGKRCRTYQRQAAALGDELSSLYGQMDQADALRNEALELIMQARTMDDPRPVLLQVSGIVDNLNAIDLSTSTGIVQWQAGADGVEVVGSDTLTAAIEEADAPLPPAQAAPSYEVVTKAEAVWDNRSRAAGAWIAAVFIDMAPFLMLLIVMALPMEPLLRDERPQGPRFRDRLPQRRTDEAIRVAEETVEGERRWSGE